ncbi:acyl-CoA dehydrogenase family protein [Prauserella rugosa]|uniref:Alkylation response protein AidB-like acyl-CoA dehydrogenase n=1 Tax=Prauserella rugosa TaxID=43354 RepID=A0A660CCJ2_9PSEU|nr:acyl-CoA dehydrogenase family protein [Prauserella rugosa]KMS92282.1 acyl-CoA dehydrogenase [Streptomyces regensis]TWH19483.1 alkylation response protein AidB-like acyl-CoA dehydrogenase [Prauserella rugosa]
MTTADLLYSDVETDLRASVRDLLGDQCSPESLLARVESDEPYDMDLWRTLARDLGTAGLAVPEELGGQGASERELALVLEELGGAVAPVPFLGSAVLATAAVARCDAADTEVAALLRGLASGERTGALAVALSTMTDAPFPTSVSASADGTLSGTAGSVADGTVADVFVVPATGPDGPGLYAVDASAAEVHAPVSFDLTRRIADVTFRGAPAVRLAAGERAERALSHALRTGAGLLASEQLGVAQWCLDETVRYIKGRYQFGRPVGSFQALKHRVADLWLELVAARAAARYAADTLARGDDDAPVAVAMAQSYCSDTAVHAAEECIQLHGGIGMTWEHPAHLYLKRAKASQVAFGAPGRHRAVLGELVDLPA